MVSRHATGMYDFAEHLLAHSGKSNDALFDLMNDLDLTSLRLFVSVCEARSISRAAAEETIVGSAISKRISQLETVVGARLLRRSQGGVRPTAAGEALLLHAYDLQRKMREIERDMSDHAEILRGRVRLFAAGTAINQFLPEDLAAFLTVPGHEHIRIDLEEHKNHQVAAAVREGGAQIGICWDVVDCQDLELREYRFDQLGITMRREHPLAHRREISLQETVDFDHIGTHASPATHATMPLLHSPSLRCRAVVSNIDSAIRLAHAGVGIAIVASAALRNFIHASDMAFVPLTDSWARRRFVLCTREFRSLPQAARMFFDHLSRQTQAVERLRA